MGNPYFRPHVNRPYDRPVEGAAYPEEHPLVGVERLTTLTREIQQSCPDIAVIGSGLQLAPKPLALRGLGWHP